MGGGGWGAGGAGSSGSTRGTVSKAEGYLVSQAKATRAPPLLGGCPCAASAPPASAPPLPPPLLSSLPLWGCPPLGAPCSSRLPLPLPLPLPRLFPPKGGSRQLMPGGGKLQDKTGLDWTLPTGTAGLEPLPPLPPSLCHAFLRG